MRCQRLEDAIAEREALSRWRLLLARSLDRLEEAAARVEASRGTFDDEELFARVEEAAPDSDERLEIAVDRAVSLIDELISGGAPGIHLYTLNQTAPVVRICERAGLSRAQAS